MLLRASHAERRGLEEGPEAAIARPRSGGAQGTVDASPRMSAQRRLINNVFPKTGSLATVEHAPVQRMGGQGGAVVQRYTQAANGLQVSTNGRFAVRNEGQDGQLYMADGVAPSALQHVVFNKVGAEVNIDGTPMSEVTATLANKPAMDQMHCRHFSQAVTGIEEMQENEHAPPGRSLYTANVTHDTNNLMGGYGWANHYAPVIVADADDRGTFETAVGLNYCWFGIYGSARGQTFRYKTQVANIRRALNEGWINHQTQQLLLTALDQYKDGVLSASAERQDYVGEELRKLEALAQERRIEAPLPVAVAEPTAVPKTLEQQHEEHARKQANSVDNEEYARRRRQFMAQEDGSERFRNLVVGLSVLALAILAAYWWW